MNIYGISDDASSGFEGEPPSQEELDLEDKVAVICGLLEQAGRGQFVAWALSEALASLARKRSPAISQREAEKLRQAALRAELAAMHLLPSVYSRDGIRTGMWALNLQITRWSGDTAAFKHLPPGVALDMDLYARIFRNDLHNMSIAQELQERQAKRQAEAEARSSRQAAVVIAEALEVGRTSLPEDKDEG